MEVTNEPDDEWEDGDNPKIRVTLVAPDGYYVGGDGAWVQ